MKSGTRSFWLAVFIIGAFLLSLPSLGVNSTAVESSPEITERSPTERVSSSDQPSILRKNPPVPLAGTNVTFTNPYASGVWDEDGNGLNDYFYINVSITVVTTIDHSKFSSWVVLAFLNYSNPDPMESDHFPQLFGFEEEAMFNEGGPGGPMSTFGETLGPVDIAIFFRGDYLNASIIGNEQLVVTGLAVLGVPTQQSLPPELLGYTGQFIGGGTPWSASHDPANYTTSTSYWASDFEPWYSVEVNPGIYWGETTINKDAEPSYEYLRLDMSLNLTINAPTISSFWARVEVELHTGARSENTTMLTKGTFQSVELYFRSQDLWWDPGNNDFPTNGEFNVTRIEIERWKGDHWDWMFDDEAEDPGDEFYSTTTVTTPSNWQRNPQDAVLRKDTSQWNLTPIDTGDSGTLYDQVQLDIQVNVSAYGLYTLSSRFGMQQGMQLETELTMWLGRNPAGQWQNMSLIFDPGMLRSVSDLGPQVLWDGFDAYNWTQLDLFGGDGQHLDNWDRVFSHSWDNVSSHFDPQTFVDPNLPFTLEYDYQTDGPMLLGDPFEFWINASTDIGDVLNITMTYPWFGDERDPPFEFDFQSTDGNYSDIGPNMMLWWDNWRISEPETRLIPLNIPEGFYAGRLLNIKVNNRLRDRPLIPQWLNLTIDFGIINDSVLPTGSITDPTGGASLSDEFGFLFQGTAQDADSGVLDVDIFLSGATDPFASTSPWHWNNPDSITQFWVDDSGDFSFVTYPDGWTGSPSIVMHVTDYAMNTNTGIPGVPVTITDDPNPSSSDLILNGLKWIVAQQQPDGSYLVSREDNSGPPVRSVAMTASVMLALLQNGSRYDDPVVQACWNYIASQVVNDPFRADNGSIYSNELHEPNYETAMAVMGLIPLNISYEVHGSYNATLNQAILNAVDYLIRIQNDETWGYVPYDPIGPTGDIYYGGWGHGDPQQEWNYGGWADLTNSHWSIIALAAAREYGIVAAADSALWQNAEDFVRRCFVNSSYWNGTHDVWEAGFVYQPPGGPYGGGTPMATMTAIGIWSLALMGYDATDSNISLALQWMHDTWWHQYYHEANDWSQDQYYGLLSAAKALLLTGHSVGSQYGWMYGSIDDFFNKHVLRNPANTGEWFWENSPGSEDAWMATIAAVLSQQIAHGVAGEVDRLVVTAECKVALHVIGPDGTHYGFNYTTGQTDTAGQSTYSGLASYPQQVIIKTPAKGIYTIVVIPLENGDCNVTIAGVTVDGKTFAIQREEIKGVFINEAYAANVTLTTIHGVNIYTEPFYWDDTWKTKLDVVIDNFDPGILVPASSLTYVNGTTGNFFNFTIIDDYPGSYTVHANTTTFLGSGSYISGVENSVSVDSLTVGTWNLTIWANDSFGHTAMNSVQATVVLPGAGDTTSPMLLASPADLTYEEGDTGTYTLIWSVTDASPGTYSITENGAPVAGTTWANGTDITYDVSGLSRGSYTYVLRVTDQAGNWIEDTVVVTVTYPASAFTLQVTDPNGGETLSGSYTITWTATGPSGEALSFDVEYSQDGGANWATIASDVTIEQFEWDTTRVANGGNYLIRVTIVGTSVSDTSDNAFAVENEEEQSSESEPPTASSPGFGILIGIMSLVTVIMLVRRRSR
ncbi:MAG: PGF-CTERM sorting domain-containing protein [Candidatus Heimdallarchaeota archaeon]